MGGGHPAEPLEEERGRLARLLGLAADVGRHPVAGRRQPGPLGDSGRLPGAERSPLPRRHTQSLGRPCRAPRRRPGIRSPRAGVPPGWPPGAAGDEVGQGRRQVVGRLPGPQAADDDQVVQRVQPGVEGGRVRGQEQGRAAPADRLADDLDGDPRLARPGRAAEDEQVRRRQGPGDRVPLVGVQRRVVRAHRLADRDRRQAAGEGLLQDRPDRVAGRRRRRDLLGEQVALAGGQVEEGLLLGRGQGGEGVLPGPRVGRARAADGGAGAAAAPVACPSLWLIAVPRDPNRVARQPTGEAGRASGQSRPARPRAGRAGQTNGRRRGNPRRRVVGRV